MPSSEPSPETDNESKPIMHASPDEENLPPQSFVARHKQCIGLSVVTIIIFIAAVVQVGSMAVATLVGVPFLYFVIRYFNLRLVEPWLHPIASPSTTHPSAGRSPRASPIKLPPFLTSLLLIICILCLVSFPVALSVGEDTATPNWFSVVFYNGLGAMLIMFVVVGVSDAIVLLAHNCHSLFSLRKMPKFPVPPLRPFLKRAQSLFILSLWTIMLIISEVHSYQNPILIRKDLPISSLPTCLSGFSVAMISDVHLGALTGPEDARHIVSLINSLSPPPDALLIVGDFGDQRVNAALHDKFDPFRKLDPNIPQFWVGGNHENYVGVEDYRVMLRTSNIVVLENDMTTLTRSECVNGEGVDIAGLPDFSGNLASTAKRAGSKGGVIKPSLKEALEDREPNPNTGGYNPLILMNHQPRDFREAVDNGVDLQLSGHTHGGQIWPMHGFTNKIFTKFDGTSGLFAYKKSFLYVGEGTIGWGPRVRMFSRPEYTVLTLQTEDYPAPDLSKTLAQSMVVPALILFPLALFVCCMDCLVGRYAKRGEADSKKTEMKDLLV